MAEIRVTSAEVRKRAEELRSLNGQFKAKVAALVECEQNLASSWEGDAKTAFHNAFNQDKGQWDNFAVVIEQYATALDNIAAEYDNKEAMNANIASSRSY
ncbi:MAG: WXG100 family type VII secretion target [Lachnospiraceae bacterium]|nr:WXG100 family type VII secretion target [Lachnospiraceae bacterium]